MKTLETSVQKKKKKGKQSDTHKIAKNFKVLCGVYTQTAVKLKWFNSLLVVKHSNMSLK